MSLKNNDSLCYVRPVGEELQHVVDKSNNTVSLHSDIYLLTRISEMQMSKQVQDMILSRFQSVADSLPSDLQEQVSKLSDDELMEMTDSRYAQWLSDRKDNVQKLMKSADDAVKSAKDNEELAKLKEANIALRDFALRLSQK